jgi:hypothetical protein
MAGKLSSIQAATAHDFEKNTGPGPSSSVSGGARTSNDDASIIAGSVHDGGEIQRGLKSRHIQFL